jgi:hypothetical protein
MEYRYSDGGRGAAGYKGNAGDCVARSIAIASGRSYTEVYSALSAGAGNERKSKGKTARNGIFTQRKWFKDYMRSIGFSWNPTMQIGSGCKVHLTDSELPLGRLVVAISRHYTAVIDGVIYDNHDPQRETHWINTVAGIQTTGISRRCVYGYWTLSP